MRPLAELDCLVLFLISVLRLLPPAPSQPVGSPALMPVVLCLITAWAIHNLCQIPAARQSSIAFGYLGQSRIEVEPDRAVPWSPPAEHDSADARIALHELQTWRRKQAIRAASQQALAPAFPTDRPFALPADSRISGQQQQIREPAALFHWQPTAEMSFSRPFEDDSRFTVIIDPGHGGTDQGTRGPLGLLEKNLTLDIARRIEKQLGYHPNIAVELVRRADTGFSRQERVSVIRQSKADLLVSLHFNSLPQTDITLVESFYASNRDVASALKSVRQSDDHSATGKMLKTRSQAVAFINNTTMSRKIAGILQRNVHRHATGFDPDTIDAGVKQDQLFILSGSHIPGTLLELGCLSNAEHELRLKSASYRNGLAESIAHGIIEYFAGQYAAGTV